MQIKNSWFYVRTTNLNLTKEDYIVNKKMQLIKFNF